MPATFTAFFGGDDVTVGTSATLLFTATSAASADNPEYLIVQNNTANQVTVGGPNVADASNGIVLAASGNVSITVTCRYPGEKVYAAADVQSVVQVLRG